MSYIKGARQGYEEQLQAAIQAMDTETLKQIHHVIETYIAGEESQAMALIEALPPEALSALLQLMKIRKEFNSTRGNAP